MNFWGLKGLAVPKESDQKERRKMRESFLKNVCFGEMEVLNCWKILRREERNCDGEK
jgi:hypothetical protein